MPNRRDFCKAVAAASLLGTTRTRAGDTPAKPAVLPADGRDDRAYWLGVVDRLATPVLEHLSRRELRKAMPVETPGDAAKLRQYTHLEAIARLLVGLAPWLAAKGLDGPEAKQQRRFAELARQRIRKVGGGMKRTWRVAKG
jgi:hypothetical protein